MKPFKKFLGVTLLEIMLVLAVAAVIIVMSVRYYQTASINQQGATALEQIQAITSIADGLAQGTGSYTAVTQSAVAALMPNQVMTTPWGTTIKVDPGQATSYVVTLPNAPAGVCGQIKPRLTTNANFKVTCSTSTAGDFVYTYTTGP